MKAYELIAKPENWTKGAAARTQDGDPTYVGDPIACQWCAVGAIWHVYDIMNSNELEQKLNQYVREKYHTSGFICWNDEPTTTHKQVVAALKDCDI